MGDILPIMPHSALSSAAFAQQFCRMHTILGAHLTLRAQDLTEGGSLFITLAIQQASADSGEDAAIRVN